MFGIVRSPSDPAPVGRMRTSVARDWRIWGSVVLCLSIVVVTNLLFIQVPEDRTAKNRVHIDLDAPDLAAARERLEGLGAEFVHEKDEHGLRWFTFRDPEDNEFCVGSHE